MAVLMPASDAAAQGDRRPERLDGFETVYARILTRPDAELLAEAGGGDGAAVPPFTPFYVYGRQDGFVEVGPSPSEAPTGWIAEASTIPWRQNVVAAFTNPAGRPRQLMFDSQESLLALMEHESLIEMEQALIEEADEGAPREGSGVVSVEPEEHLDIQENFYILPILDFEETFHPLTYLDNLHLKVASVPLQEAGGAARTAETFEAGIVFVIDTTQSMEPYIQETRAALMGIIDTLRASPVAEAVHFGAIAFRDNPDSAPGLEYRTRIVAPLARRPDIAAVAEAVGATAEAEASSRRFNEDSLSGIASALELDWDQEDDPFGGRYIVLVTDAGPKPAADPDSGTGLNVEEVRGLAAEADIAVLTLHVKTPSGAGNHDYAEQAYRALSRFGQDSYYYPIEGEDRDAFRTAFRAQAERIAQVIVNDVATARDEAAPFEETEATEAERVLGNAMLLSYLGGGGQAQAPDVFEAWVSALAISDSAQTALEPRLLLTKNELATVSDLTRDFIDMAEGIESTAEAEAFFDELQTAIVRLSQNPDRVLNPEAETAGDALEFLRDLPYRSQILNMDMDRWIASAVERRTIVDGLKPKQRLYRALLEDSRVWTALHEGAADGEHVYPIPLAFLP